jgi:hypothetical protein
MRAYVQRKLLLLDSLATRPINTRVLTGQVAGLSSIDLNSFARIRRINHTLVFGRE